VAALLQAVTAAAAASAATFQRLSATFCKVSVPLVLQLVSWAPSRALTSVMAATSAGS
jgi:hypothetical protein